jgi:hypothetical protein
MYQSSRSLDMPVELTILQLDPQAGMCHRERTRTTTINNSGYELPGQNRLGNRREPLRSFLSS